MKLLGFLNVLSLSLTCNSHFSKNFIQSNFSPLARDEVIILRSLLGPCVTNGAGLSVCACRRVCVAFIVCV